MPPSREEENIKSPADASPGVPPTRPAPGPPDSRVGPDQAADSLDFFQEFTSSANKTRRHGRAPPRPQKQAVRDPLRFAFFLGGLLPQVGHQKGEERDVNQVSGWSTEPHCQVSAQVWNLNVPSLTCSMLGQGAGQPSLARTRKHSYQRHVCSYSMSVCTRKRTP